MRKLFVAVAALGMLLTSCAKDADVVTGGNESMVTFNVAQPELSTRAATGTKDAEDQYGTGFTAEALQYAIFEVKEGRNEKRLVREDLDFFAGDILKGSLTERLVNGKTYIAVFWADVQKGKYYTVDWDNGTISFNDATVLNAQNEELDAFWGMTDEFTVNGPVTVSATLKRPFAQLNISTCDTDVAAAAGLVVKTSSLTVSKVYTAFNFWSGEVDANSETVIEFKSAAIPDSYYYDIEGTKYDVLSLNYLLVNDKKNVDVVFQYEGSGLDFEREFTSVPVQRNHRTHIIGNLLTDVATINIEIDPMFEDPDHLVDADLLHAFQYGGAVELTRDVVLSAPLEMLNDVETTINLNGHTITYANPDENAYTAVFMVKKGTLTIEGEGDVVAEGEGNIAVWAGRGDAENDGKVIIKGGNFSNTTSQELIYTTNKGVIEIYGGTFQVAEEDQESFAEPQYPVLNLYGNGKTGNDIIVYGGTFYNFNPADNVSENPKKNFVADGHASIASTDAEGNNIYTVVEAKEMEGLTVAALGYQNAKLSWTAVDGADHYKVSYGTWTSDKITGTEYAAMPVETVKDSRKPVFQVVAYDANGSTLAMGQTAGDVEIFTLFERPVPEVRLANGALTVATDLDYAAKMGNAHLYGVMLAAEVYFYKDGATTPTYTAKATAADQAGVNTNYATAANNDKKMKGSNMVMALTTWQWAEGTGAFGSATNVAPAFEPGTYTMAIKGHYFPTVGAYYSVSAGGNLAFESADRIVFTGIIMPNATNGDVNATLNGAILREDAIEGSFSIASVEGIAAARNGYKGIEVTWNAVTGATSYEVVADGQKATVSEAKAQFTAADTQHSFTNFSVTALDANGAVVAVGNLAAETQVWTLANTPAPVVTFVDGKLTATNLVDVTGVALKMTVNFTKEGEATPAYTAYSEHYFNSTSDIRINIDTDQKFKFADFDTFTKWTWDGSTDKANATDAAQSFEPGTYKVTYTAQYYPIVGGYWTAQSAAGSPVATKAEANRIKYPAAESVLEVETPYEGVADDVVVGVKLEVSAAIDEGLENIVPGSPFTHSGKYNSINGIYEGAKISWNLNVPYDKVVIAYNGKTVEVTDASTSKIVTDVTTSPTTFTVTAYNGATQVATADVTSNIYTLTKNVNPVSFTIKKHADNKHFIFVDGGMTGDAYAFQSLYFNVYEESDTSFANPIFTNDVTKNGDGGLNQTEKAWAAYGKYSYAKVDNSDYDTNCTPEYTKEKIAISIAGYSPNAEGYFSGLQSGKTYVIKYTLKAYPFIWTGNMDGSSFVFSSILMNNDVITNHPIVGTYTVTAE